MWELHTIRTKTGGVIGCARDVGNREREGSSEAKKRKGRMTRQWRDPIIRRKVR